MYNDSMSDSFQGEISPVQQPQKSEINLPVSNELHMFAIDDLKALAQKNWALRHLSSSEKAQYEFEHGIEKGDALAISAGLRDRLKPFTKNPIYANYHPEIIIDSMDEVDQFLLLDKYQTSFTQFIEASIGYDMFLHEEQETVGSMLEKLRSSSSFLIMDVPNVLPYDQMNYYNIGKIGKTNISPTQMVQLITPSDIMTNIIEQERLTKQMDQQAFEDIKQRASRKTLSILLTTLRETAQEAKEKNL